MCGIAGILGRGPNREAIGRMADSLRHRGPDGEGIWRDDRIALGHRRLKIIDLSENAAQPMHTPDGRFHLVFNGEIYNYVELARELVDFRFRTRSDTEVLLAAYEKWGSDCLGRLRGMFAFAVWDSVRGELFCARDHVGMKPLYWHFDGATLVFASEIRGLLAYGLEAHANEGVIYDFLARDCYEHGEATFFAGINSVPPGGTLTVTADGVPRVGSYWDLPSAVDKVDVPARLEDRIEKLYALLDQTVAIHLRSDVTVGVALSGGIDSAILLGLTWRRLLEHGAVRSFTWHFSEESYSERPHVEALLQNILVQPHFTALDAEGFRARWELSAIQQQEPHAGLPIVAYADCVRQARECGVIVLNDGSGLDEGFAGYARFLPARWADLFALGDYPQLQAEFEAAGIGDERSRVAAIGQMADVAIPSQAVGIAQDGTRSVKPGCMHPELAASAPPQPDFARPFGDALRNLMFRDLRYVKLPRALRFRDRLSMAYGVEMRVPFLDAELLAYAFALPAVDLIQRGTQKFILRQAMRSLIPPQTLDRPKQQVQTPQREWFRTTLRPAIRDVLEGGKFWERGWVDRGNGRRALEQYFAGYGDNSFFIWQWVNLELWAQQFLDKTSRHSTL
jgi:asparagine synthase (glutamine-hydrolysing)